MAEARAFENLSPARTFFRAKLLYFGDKSGTLFQRARKLGGNSKRLHVQRAHGFPLRSSYKFSGRAYPKTGDKLLGGFKTARRRREELVETGEPRDERSTEARIAQTQSALSLSLSLSLLLR